MVTVSVSDAPWSSVTVSRTSKMPVFSKVWVGFASVEVDPSRKSQTYFLMPKSSLELLPLKLTFKGASPLEGLASAAALGAAFFGASASLLGCRSAESSVLVVSSVISSTVVSAFCVLSFTVSSSVEFSSAISSSRLVCSVAVSFSREISLIVLSSTAISSMVVASILPSFTIFSSKSSMVSVGRSANNAISPLSSIRTASASWGAL